MKRTLLVVFIGCLIISAGCSREYPYSITPKERCNIKKDLFQYRNKVKEKIVWSRCFKMTGEDIYDLRACLISNPGIIANGITVLRVDVTTSTIGIYYHDFNGPQSTEEIWLDRKKITVEDNLAIADTNKYVPPLIINVGQPQIKIAWWDSTKTIEEYPLSIIIGRSNSFVDSLAVLKEFCAYIK